MKLAAVAAFLFGATSSWAGSTAASLPVGLSVHYREIARFDSFVVDHGLGDPWSPRGARLLLLGTHEGRYGTYVVDFDDPTFRLQRIGRYMPNTLWSPDGNWVIAQLEPPNHWKSDEYIVVAALSVDGTKRVELDVPDETWGWSWAEDGVFRYFDRPTGPVRALALSDTLDLVGVRAFHDSVPGIVTVPRFDSYSHGSGFIARCADGTPVEWVVGARYPYTTVQRDRTPANHYLVWTQTDSGFRNVICDARGRIGQTVATWTDRVQSPTSYFPRTMLPDGSLIGIEHGGSEAVEVIGAVVATADFQRRAYIPLPAKPQSDGFRASAVRSLIAWNDEAGVVHVGELRVTPK